MASAQSRFSDQRYLNWLKDTLSLLYLKEGIENIVDTEAGSFHIHLQRALGVNGTATQTCFSCTPSCMIRRRTWQMTCQLCNLWLKQIVQSHRYQPLPNLYPDNTNPQRWPTHPWEIVKCFMPYGCQKSKSAKDGDAQAILSLFKNCLHFTSCGRIGRLDLIEELLGIRNALFHSGEFKVEDADLKVHMKTMLDFLTGMTPLSSAENQSIKQAVGKITELKKNRLDVSLHRELELQALQQKQNALDIDVQRLEHDLKTTAAKTNLTGDTVKSIQHDLCLLEKNGQNLQQEHRSKRTKTDTLEAELKSLGHEVRSKQSKTAFIKTDHRRHQHISCSINKCLKSLQREDSPGAAKTTAIDTDVDAQKDNAHRLQEDNTKDIYRVANLQTQLAWFLGDIGEYDKAIDLLKNVITQISVHHGDISKELVDPTHCMIFVLHRKALQYVYRDHPGYIDCCSLGRGYADQCASIHETFFASDKRRYGRVLSLCGYFVDSYLETAKEILTGINDQEGLAEVLFMQGEANQYNKDITIPIQLFTESLRLCLSMYGKLHFNTARCYQLFGQMYWNNWVKNNRQDWLESCLNLYKQECEILEEIQGESHPNTVRSREDVIIVLQTLQRHDEAKLYQVKQPKEHAAV